MIWNFFLRGFGWTLGRDAANGLARLIPKFIGGTVLTIIITYHLFTGH